MFHGLLQLAIPVVESTRARGIAVRHFARENKSINCDVFLNAWIRALSNEAALEEKAAASI